MKLLFPASGNGDCIFCLINKEDDTYYSMMVDCHCFTPEIKAIITDTLHCHLDYLVVTHIDTDHINGICNMLYQMPELRIDHIIYNNLFAKEDDAQVEPLNDFQRKQIEALKVCIPTWKPNIENKVAKKEALALSTLIQRNWADAWDKKLTLIDGEYLSLGGLGRIFIVSPTQTAIDELRKEGKKVGLLKIRVFRPFPMEELAEALKHVKMIAVMDKSEGFSAAGGPVFAEVRSALYDCNPRPKMINYVYGLGGRDVTVSHIKEIFEVRLWRIFYQKSLSF